MNKISILAVIMFLSFSCSGPVENTSSIDANLYGETSDIGPQEFKDTMQAIRTSCIFCHAEWNTYTQQNFIDAGLVTPGNATTSKLYYRNTNALTGVGPKNMPYGGYPTIGATALSQMNTWINNL